MLSNKTTSLLRRCSLAERDVKSYCVSFLFLWGQMLLEELMG